MFIKIARLDTNSGSAENLKKIQSSFRHELPLRIGKNKIESKL